MENFKVFCLPFAGGNKYSYRTFDQYARGLINLIHLEYPGRGMRAQEPLLDNIYDLAEDAFDQIQDQIDGPFALYGHSMGALVGYLVAKKLVQEDKPPCHLFLTGRRAPSIPEDEPAAHLLPKAEFIEKLKEFGGSPPDILNDPDLMEYFEPIIRADFKALDTYKYDQPANLQVPTTVVTGIEEKITYEEAVAWEKETNAKFTARQFPGNHFFIYGQEMEIIKIMFRTLSTSVNLTA